MKYTIEGFNQAKLVELNLDGNDALILRWYVDFLPKMTTITFNGIEYKWVKYQAVIDDLPILGINNKNNIARRFDKFVQSGIMEKHVHKDGGNFTTFKLTMKYIELVEVSTQKDIPIYSKVESYLPESRKGIYSKVETKDSSINNSSINSSIINTIDKHKPEKSEIFDITKEQKPRLMNDRTWELFKEWWTLSRKQHKLANTKRAYEIQIKKMHLNIDVCNDNQYEIVEFSMNYNKDKTFQNICLPNKYQEKVDNVNELLNSMSEWMPKL